MTILHGLVREHLETFLAQVEARTGARLLSSRLTAAGVKHVYEEFDDTHSDIDYRMDTSLPFLVQALRG